MLDEQGVCVFLSMSVHVCGHLDCVSMCVLPGEDVH